MGKKEKIEVFGIAVGISTSVLTVIKGIEAAVKDHIEEREAKWIR